MAKKPTVAEERDAERCLIARLAYEAGYQVGVLNNGEGQAEFIVQLSSGQIRLPLSKGPVGFLPFHGWIDPEGEEAAYDRMMRHVTRGRTQRL